MRIEDREETWNTRLVSNSYGSKHADTDREEAGCEEVQQWYSTLHSVDARPYRKVRR